MAQVLLTVSDGQEKGWLCPAGVTSITVHCWGGGGAGGGILARPASGGGGAGGSYAYKAVIPVTPGEYYQYRVGRGGVGGNTTGAPGESSYFFDQKTLYAQGGNGGGGTNVEYVNSSPALGSVSGSVGDLVRRGGNGFYGYFTKGFSGAGGGGAGYSANGGDATLGIAGKGTPDYGGDGGSPALDINDGLPGFDYGGGGSGAVWGGRDEARWSYPIGGNGGDGLILIEYDVQGVQTGSSKLVTESGLVVDSQLIHVSNTEATLIASSLLTANAIIGRVTDKSIKVANIKVTSNRVIKNWWKLNYFINQ